MTPARTPDARPPIPGPPNPNPEPCFLTPDPDPQTPPPDLRQDVEVECKKAGAVDKVFVFEASERGAVIAKFKAPEDAQRCVAMMNERKFGGAQISCVFYDGVTDYRALSVREAAAAPSSNSVEEQEKDLNDYADWLEAESTDEELAADEGDD